MSSVLDDLDLHPVSIPMRHRFRRVDHREAVLIKGPNGWGEFSPFPDYPPEQTSKWLAAALELACGDLPAPGRPMIEVNVTVPAVDPVTAALLVTESGARTAKVKVGDPRDDETTDTVRLEAVQAALGPGGRMRIDANASWDLDTATSRLARLERFGLEYVEQPVATLEEMRELRRRVTIPLAADELVRQGTNPLRVIEEGGADVLILKAQPMGGVAPILDLAGRAGVPVVLSSALETSVGMYAGLLAASLVDSPYAFGLGTVSMLVGDPTNRPLLAVMGQLEVRRPEPDPDLLQRWRPVPDVASSLLARLRLAAGALT